MKGDKECGSRNAECGIGTRRRPKRTGLWRGNHAEGGKKEGGKVGKKEVEKMRR